MIQPRYFLQLAFLFIFLSFNNTLYSQKISDVTYPSSILKEVKLVSFTTLGTLIGPGQDDTNSAIAAIGFDFWFSGTRYTQFGVSTNGYLKLGSVATAAGALSHINDLATDLDTPKIAPFFDNCTTGSDGYVKYGLKGNAPNRVLIVEWKVNLFSDSSSVANAATMNFQVVLSESTGKIQYIYGTDISSTSSSIGFGTSSSNLVSIATATNVAAYGKDPNIGQIVTIKSGKSYVFAPLSPIAPTQIPVEEYTANSMHLNWYDNSTNEVGFVVYLSTDNINFTFNKQVTANTSSTTITDLQAGKPYYFRIYAVTEGALSFPPLVASRPQLVEIVLTKAGTGTWIPSACVTSIIIESWGGGGGGGNSPDISLNKGGTGGGGGAHAAGIVSVVPGNIYYYTIGVGGKGASKNNGNTSTNGGNTWFNGEPKLNSQPSSTDAGVLAVGGGMGAMVNNNSKTKGNQGSLLDCLGNMSIFSGGNGNAGRSTDGGSGGLSHHGGKGGKGGKSSSGENGNFPGGGGGGSSNKEEYYGGNGGDGKMVISYLVPVHTIAAVPIINQPLAAGITTVSGTSSEENGATITVFKNAVNVGTAIVNSGVWTKTDLEALVAGDSITASASANCKISSEVSANVKVNN